MTKEELFDKIIEYEDVYAESFIDRFCHDFIRDSSWAFWLLGKGYNKHANVIIDKILNKVRYIDQDILFDVYSPINLNSRNNSFNEENYHKNLLLISEFLCSTPYYLEMVTNFLKESEE